MGRAGAARGTGAAGAKTGAGAKAETTVYIWNCRAILPGAAITGGGGGGAKAGAKAENKQLNKAHNYLGRLLEELEQQWLAERRLEQERQGEQLQVWEQA